MADAILKISDAAKQPDACKTADNDGLLVTTLLEALTATNRLDVGAHGRSTYSPTNYSTAGQSIDQHLTGINSALAAHALGGSQHTTDSLANLNSKVTGGDLDFDTASRSPSGSATGDLTNSYPNPQVAKIRGYAVQAHAPLDGEVLKWVSSNSQYEPTAAGAPGAHALGGASHTADTLANLNSKITGVGNLDFDSAERTAIQHSIGSNLRHSSATLAQLNALVSDATLDTNTASRTPSAHKNWHKSAGPDAFESTDLLEAVVKRLQVTGPVTLLVGAVADGEYLKRSGTGIIGTNSPTFNKVTINQTAAQDSLDVQDGGTQVLKVHDGGIVDLPKQSGCHAYRNAVWDLPDASWTKIPFDAELWDNQSEFHTGNNEFTVTKTGYYLITGCFRLTVAAGSNLAVAIALNGAKAHINYRNGNGWVDTMEVTAIQYIEATTTIQLHGYQDSGAARALQPGPGYTKLQIMKLA